jgi:hypothetical protein
MFLVSVGSGRQPLGGSGSVTTASCGLQVVWLELRPEGVSASRSPF